MNVTTKSGRLLSALQSGEALTVAQIKSRYSIGNPTATISDLRFSGYAIYANRHTDSKGKTSTKYKLGKPSRAIIAAGYRALADGLELPNKLFV